MDRLDRLEHLQERVDALRSVGAQPNAVIESRDLEDLAAALEQLHLAEVEMQHQNAELAAARDALEVERTRYRELFELAPDAHLLTNADGLVCEANRAAARLLKVERRFLIGKPLQVFLPSDDRTSFRAQVRHAQDTEAPIEWRMRVVPRDGTPIDVAAAVAPTAERHQGRVGLRWSLRDVTSQVRDEDRLRDLNAELERRVADRTAALEAANRAKDELLRRERAARDAAEEANRSKDEFLATISHELRTPLNVVLGWTFRMRSHTLDGDQTEKAIEVIDRNARQQLHLVEELLDTARIATGRFELELDTYELGPLLQTAVEALEATATAKGITITTAIDSGIYVRADPVRIRQIAWNLVSNSLKFTPERGTVHVALEARHDHAVIVIADTGIGIAPQALLRLFEPFWQADQSTRRARSGLGLGLAIVRHLVELHGGRVEASSKGLDKGATFKVWLPLVAAGQPRAADAVEV